MPAWTRIDFIPMTQRDKLRRERHSTHEKHKPLFEGSKVEKHAAGKIVGSAACRSRILAQMSDFRRQDRPRMDRSAITA